MALNRMLSRARLFVLLTIAAGLVIPVYVEGEFQRSAYAQVDSADGSVDGGADGSADGGNTTAVATEIPGAGIVIDAKGVLKIKRSKDATGQLSRHRRREARPTTDPNLARVSELRKISLNRLEDAVARQLANGQAPTDEIRFLAGLTDIKYIFFLPETKDIVIAGRAEGFILDERSRPVGVATGRAIMQLEDLIVALRTFGPKSTNVGTVGVSIDPTRQGLRNMQRFLQAFGRRAVPADTGRIVEELRNSLGRQIVSVHGVSPNSHFAGVMVEADYRMKLIGIGLENPPVRIISYVRRASPSRVSRNALQRWYFVPNYESIQVSDDGFAVELIGNGVKLINAYELVRPDGTRAVSKKVDRASRIFVESFTRHYPELARKVPVYAQLEHLIDMLVAAAYIQDQDFYGLAEWSMDIFGNEELMPVEIYAAPKEVDTAVNAIWKGNVLMTPIGGGVRIDARRAIADENLRRDLSGELERQREKFALHQSADGRWWWD